MLPATKVKKILQSIVLLLLLLVISSNLLASSYSRTAGGSWDDWGWSADWIPPFSFPIGQVIALGLTGGAIMDLKAAYKAYKLHGITQARFAAWLNALRSEYGSVTRRLFLMNPALGRVFSQFGNAITNSVVYKQLFQSGLLKLLGAGFFEFLDRNVLGFSTPNFFQFLPYSWRSGVDNFQLGWSKKAGPWLYYFTRWLLGTPGGMFDDITLFNEETDPQNFDLNGDRTLNGLNVVGNSWTLHGGTLTLRPWDRYQMVMVFSGTAERRPSP